MDTTAPDDLTGRADDATDLDRLFDVLSQAASNAATDLEEPVQEPEDTGYKGFRLRWKKRPLPEAEDVVPSPSLAPSDLFRDNGTAQTGAVVPELAPKTTSADHSASVAHSFLSGFKATDIVLPGEQSWLAPIFGDVVPSPSLSMPANWDPSFVDPISAPLPGTASVPAPVADFSITRCVKNRIDRTFLEERASQTERALAKMFH